MKQEDYQDKRSRAAKCPGFTLIELLVTVALAAIVTALAIPSFSAALRSIRLTGYANEMVGVLNYARSEAVKRGASVTVRKVDNSSCTKADFSAEWEDGWDVFTDVNGNGVCNATDALIRTYPAIKSSFSMRGTIDGVTFNLIGGAQNGSIVICENSDGNFQVEPNMSRLIRIRPNGRVNVLQDLNNPPDGIPNFGTALTSNLTVCIEPFV